MSAIEVLVKFECNSRKLTLSEGTLEALKKEFMKIFDDVIPHDVLPSKLLFQRFDSRYQEWVDMTADEKICDGDKIRVLDLSSSGTSSGTRIPPHRIKRNTTYRIWSLVSRTNGSLMKRDDTIMKSDGSVASDEVILLNIKAKDVSDPTYKLYRLELQVPDTSSKCYVITGQSENQDVIVQEVDASSPPNTPDTKFEPEYFYAFTRFRCLSVNGENDLYLASDENGKMIMAKGGLREFPNPTTLFICNQII
ncbi:uncharacterized protein LOC116287747 [Actinia tenebrosa]|uniref:Uncharacterized protein LOC116287747 n=1 Tax=Actinia tenebrosa TaxID=6105 RepID=A0A6P8H1M2_ACTTE|nr:uncharacterized protein LOC116287747 [Actinia tenebrosa]